MSKRTGQVAGGIFVGAAIGALDGYAASADAKAGRQWASPGISYIGAPVLAWGWAPAVQVGAVVTGIALEAAGQNGSTPLVGGAILMARAGALTVARRNKPVSVQGYGVPQVVGPAVVLDNPLPAGGPTQQQHATIAG